MVGVSYQQVQRYENGTTVLNVSNLQRIAKSLSISITQFFESENTAQSITCPLITSPPADEISLIKSFRKISIKTDRQLLVSISRRLAAKK